MRREGPPISPAPLPGSPLNAGLSAVAQSREASMRISASALRSARGWRLRMEAEPRMVFLTMTSTFRSSMSLPNGSMNLEAMAARAT